MKKSRLLSKLREPVNGLTHLLAALFAVGGLGLLLYLGRGSTAKLIALGVYGLSLILMFATSAAYHSIHAGARTMVLLRKLDHLAIYLLIAGTYTPICLFYLPGAWRTALLVTIWALAAAGMAVKLFIIKAPRWVTAGVYLLMGWLGVIAAGEVLREERPGLAGPLLVFVNGRYAAEVSAPTAAHADTYRYWTYWKAAPGQSSWGFSPAGASRAAAAR